MKRFAVLLLAIPLLVSCKDDKDTDGGKNTGTSQVTGAATREYYNFPVMSDAQTQEYFSRLEGVWEMEGPLSTDGRYYYVVQPSTGISMESSNLIDNILVYTDHHDWELSAKEINGKEVIRVLFNSKHNTPTFFFTFIDQKSIYVECFDSDNKIMTMGVMTPKNGLILKNSSEIIEPLLGTWKEIEIEDSRPVSYIVFSEGWLHSRYTFNGDEEFTDADYRIDNHIAAENKSADGYSYQAVVSIPYNALPMRVYIDEKGILWYRSKYAFPIEGAVTRTSPPETHTYETYGWQQFERIDTLPEF